MLLHRTYKLNIPARKKNTSWSAKVGWDIIKSTFILKETEMYPSMGKKLYLDQFHHGQWQFYAELQVIQPSQRRHQSVTQQQKEF